MLNLQPSLQGERVRLRPLQPQDYAPLYRVAADPLLWEQHPDPSRSSEVGYRGIFDKALQSGGALIAVDALTQAVIGCTRYHSYVPKQTIAIGYTFLSRAYWGGATNGEIKRLMLAHAFTDVAEVQFLVAEHNMRSRRAVEKLGAELVGAEPAPRYGQLHLVYRLTPALWSRADAPDYKKPRV
jgi:N-acetyltransferase